MPKKNRNIETWLAFSHALFSDLMPADLQPELSGMTSSGHAAIIDRQAMRVDAALAALALAAGEPEVLQIFGSLEKETLITLCSRWCRYHEAWKRMLFDPKAHQWMPPDQKDLWRAVFLAMLSDTDVASALQERLWTGVSGVPRG